MNTTRLLIGLVLFGAGCQPDAPRPTPDAVPSVAVASARASVEPVASAAPTVVEVPAPVVSVSAMVAPVESAAPSASAQEEPAEPYCMTAAESIENAKPHENAKPPFSNCAVGIFSHCGGGNGERGHLCSKPLDEKATALTRKTKPGMCCYRM